VKPAHQNSQTLHASAVAIGTQAVLVLGPSGSGKSTLALDLMSRGGVLVSDDRTLISLRDGGLIATPPEAIRGRIEARGVGLLMAEVKSPVLVSLVVDLGAPEPERLPPRRKITLLDVEVDLIYGKGNTCLAGAVHAWLIGGRVA